jgi:rRNA maturation endonuclease Nob1
MNEGVIQEKKPDEIYCPSCAKPIKKDAVICPNCGVQVKELKVSAEVKTMTPEQELEEGKRQLGGVKAY